MSSPTLFKEVTSEQEQSVMKEKQSENQKWFLEIKTMTLRKHFISINMLGNRPNQCLGISGRGNPSQYRDTIF